MCPCVKGGEGEGEKGRRGERGKGVVKALQNGRWNSEEHVGRRERVREVKAGGEGRRGRQG